MSMPDSYFEEAYRRHRVVMPREVADTLEEVCQTALHLSVVRYKRGELPATAAAEAMAVAWDLYMRCNAGEIRDFDIPTLAGYCRFEVNHITGHYEASETQEDKDAQAQAAQPVLAAWKWLNGHEVA